ncbi:MAG: IclR family transcriptional regulator [Spirochaetales bacterium]|nr:IclR family transcriptional regulator [Spirochaetales bacterium]
MELVPAIAKADAIFSYLEKAKSGAYLKEISADLKIPKSTAHRILTTLISLHYVELEPFSSKYTLGPKFLAIARTVEKRISLSQTALPFMRELSSLLMETVKLSILRDDTVYVISSVESPRKMKITVESGTVFAPHVGAAGKLLLAYCDKQERDRILSNPLEKLTPNTITDKEKLISVLTDIRNEGFARDREEETIGISALSFPVHDAAEHVTGAVSVPYLTALRKEEELFDHIRLCARDISRALGAQL